MLGKVAALLSAHKIPAAASLAIAAGYPRLATMITQVGPSLLPSPYCSKLDGVVPKAGVS